MNWTTLSGEVRVELPKTTLERSLHYNGLSTSLTLQHCGTSTMLRNKSIDLWPTLAREAIVPLGDELEASVADVAWRPNAFKELHACRFIKAEVRKHATSGLIRCAALCRGIYTRDPVMRAKRVARGGVFCRITSGTRMLERLLVVVATCASTVDLWFDPKKERNSSIASQNVQ